MDYEVIIPDQLENEFSKFIKILDKESRARVLREINLLEEKGIDLEMPYSKKIDKIFWELRTTGNQKVRILYCFDRQKIYLLNWFVKKTKKLPSRELEKAHKRLHYTYHL